MDENNNKKVHGRKDGLVGVLRTRLAGNSYYAPVTIRDFFTFERDPSNPHDSNAVMVMKNGSRVAGHLPARVVSWLSELLDNDVVRLSGGRIDREYSEYKHAPYLSIDVIAGESWEDVSRPFEGPVNEFESLHNLVLAAYDGASKSPGFSRDLYRRIKHLKQGDLLPGTMLLLKLIPSMERVASWGKRMGEVRAAADRLEQVAVSEAVHAGWFTIFPLHGDGRNHVPYVLLSDAVTSGAASVHEKDGHGFVPEIVLHNNLGVPILINEGELLVGAKQDRTINVTIMAPAESEFVVPVSCVEAGRWHHTSEGFSAESVAPRKVRHTKLKSVIHSVMAGGAARSDQEGVWESVSSLLNEADTRSRTSCVTDAIRHERENNELLDHKPDLPGDTRGVVVTLGDKLLGIELFDSPGTFGKLWKRIWESYVVGTPPKQEQEAKGPEPDPEFAKKLVQEITTRLEPSPVSLGEGVEVVVKTGDMVGSGVVYDGVLCALSVLSG
ncbi:MAG: hypothetical protein GXP49_04920 [Deltaproteobacteria bacterium]|nr:hypothetical protein [Deltaproteobacteria bacterium]